MKKFLYILWSIAFVLLGVYFILIFFSKYSRKIFTSRKIYRVNLIDGSDGSDHIIIPVTIKNVEYPFAFDTGSTLNLIDSVLAEKLGLTAHDKVIKTIERFTETDATTDSIAYTNVKCSLGNLRTSGVFYINNNNFIHIQECGPIIGMEIINRFNWLFNFEDNTVTISKGEIKIQKLPDDQILTIDYFCDKFGITSMNLTIDNVIIQNVIFDTGFGRKNVKLLNKSKNLDIVFSKNYLNTLASLNKHPTLCIPSVIGNMFILDSMQINGFTMQGVLALNHNDFTESIITAHFIRRFRLMYYDSTNRKIQLYVSPSDSVLHNRRDLQLFYRSFFRFNEENKSIDYPKQSIPSEVTDLLLNDTVLINKIQINK